jgi:hypothetical protein
MDFPDPVIKIAIEPKSKVCALVLLVLERQFVKEGLGLRALPLSQLASRTLAN